MQPPLVSIFLAFHCQFNLFASPCGPLLFSAFLPFTYNFSYISRTTLLNSFHTTSTLSPFTRFASLTLLFSLAQYLNFLSFVHSLSHVTLLFISSFLACFLLLTIIFISTRLSLGTNHKTLDRWTTESTHHWIRLNLLDLHMRHHGCISSRCSIYFVLDPTFHPV